jgi:hypothetical protein
VKRAAPHPRWAVEGALLAALFAVATAASAEPRWFPALAPGSVQLPSSAEIVADDELVYQAPSASAPRRGAARIGARLPVFGWQAASGCPGRWLLVGAFAWLCDDKVRLSDWPPEQTVTAQRSSEGLPYRYHFVGPDGSFGYASLPTAEEVVPSRQFEPGFAVAVARVENKPTTGEPFALTSHGLWLPVRDLVPANPSAFEGALVEAGEAALSKIAWTFSDTAVFEDARSTRLVETLPSLSRVQVREVVATKRGQRVEIAPSRFVDASDLRRPRVRAAPVDLRPEERWIAVDLATQTLVAYQGTRPWFATLVSTGRGADESAEATPRGEFRIWVKLVSTDMTNLENLEARRYYAIEDVPWVMFFKDGYGLHGAFWHHSFGNQRSHGCVNLSPRDAERLFHWASPRVPTGFRAVHPTAHDPGTPVVVF